MAFPTPIDPRRLQEYSGGDLEFEQELLELFITDAEQHLQGIEEAVAQIMTLEEADSKESNISQHLEIIRQEAHHLKGASGNIGAYSFQAIATQIEQDAKHGIRASYASQLSHLKQAFTEVITQVRQWPPA